MANHSFERISVVAWTGKECVDWANNVCQENSLLLPMHDINAVFATLNGSQLLELNRKNDFYNLVGQNDLFFKCDLEKRINTNNIVTPQDTAGLEYRSNSEQLSFTDVSFSDGATLPEHLEDLNFLDLNEDFDCLENAQFNYPGLDFLDDPYLVPVDSITPSIPLESFLIDESLMTENQADAEDYESLHTSPSDSERFLSSPYSMSSAPSLTDDDMLFLIKHEASEEPSLRDLEGRSSSQAMAPSSAPGSRRSERKSTPRRTKRSVIRRSMTSDNCDHQQNSTQSTSHFVPSEPIATGVDPLEKIRTGNRKRDRGPKNWEFLARLALDKSSNPSLISWEDSSSFTFRIVRPKEVAEIWGNRGEKDISYDSFARGLRYHYGKGGLKDVREQKLVYAFGEKAIKFMNGIYKSLEDQGKTSSNQCGPT